MDTISTRGQQIRDNIDFNELSKINTFNLVTIIARSDDAEKIKEAWNTAIEFFYAGLHNYSYNDDVEFAVFEVVKNPHTPCEVLNDFCNNTDLYLGDTCKEFYEHFYEDLINHPNADDELKTKIKAELGQD